MNWQRYFGKTSARGLAPTALVGIALLAGTVAATAQQFTIGAYYLQSSVRTSRTQYDYTYTADLYNGAGASGIITGTVVSNNPNTLVI